jgi:calcineurin-like phosphoesterase family protein
MYFFTSDEHYGHANIIKYCNRPFYSVEDMDNAIIGKFNSVVSKNDTTIHAGDFTLGRNEHAKNYIKQLNGNHIFLQGSHDKWLPTYSHQIWTKKIDSQYIVVCHYAMRVWPRSHYNSWQLYGHSHGGLDPVGKQWDIGVDTHYFYPYSLDEIIEIMKNRSDNFNYIKD